MKRIYSPLHVTAVLVGVMCTTVEVFSNVDHIVHQTHSLYDPSVAAVIATSIGVVIALACAMEAFRQRHFGNGVALAIAFALGAGYTLTTTLDRVSTVRDATLSKKWDNDPQYRELLTLHQKVQYMAARECGSGRGIKCDSISQEVTIAQKRIEARQGELDSMGKRLAALIPGVSASAASTYQPMLLPVSLFLMGSWFVAFGLNGRKVPSEFNLGLTGKDAVRAKAERFSDAFQKVNGRLPKPLELQRELGVTVQVSRRLHKELQV